MPDNQLFQPLRIQQPDPQQPSPADAWTTNTKLLTEYLDRQQQQAQQQGLWTGGQAWEGGHPTGAGMVNAAQQTGNALLMGTTAPGAPRLSPMDSFMDAVDAAHSKAGLDKISHINLFDHTPTEAEISHIGVDAEHRGKGVGNQIMQIVTDAADKHGITLHASPASDADASTGLDYHGLRDWYDRWGFDKPGGGDRLTRDPYAPEPAPGIRAFHGSPYDFERFDAGKIGTGEGAQAYGHGLYFAGNEGVARSYRDNLSGGLSADDAAAYSAAHNKAMDLQQELSGLHELAVYHSVNKGMPLDADWGEIGMQYHPDVEALFRPKMDRLEAGRDAAMSQAQDIMQNAPRSKGSMYEVNIAANPEHFLDWDKPLSEQSRHVQDFFQGVPGIEGASTGAEAYRLLGRGQEHELSAAMQRSGIPGIRYLDQQSRLQPGQVSINQRIVADAQQRLAANPNDAQAAKELASAKADLADWEAKGTTSNHVVFDPATIEILRKYGIAGLIAGGGAAAATQQGQPPT